MCNIENKTIKYTLHKDIGYMKSETTYYEQKKRKQENWRQRYKKCKISQDFFD